MNAIDMARMAYAGGNAPVKTERRSEYDVIAKVTQNLKEAADSDKFPDLARALHDNRRLWTIFAVDLVDDDNGLPEEIRARLLYLAEYTLRTTSSILSGSVKPQVLIDVNLAVMRGLQPQRAVS